MTVNTFSFAFLLALKKYYKRIIHKRQVISAVTTTIRGRWCSRGPARAEHANQCDLTGASACQSSFPYNCDPHRGHVPLSRSSIFANIISKCSRLNLKTCIPCVPCQLFFTSDLLFRYPLPLASVFRNFVDRPLRDWLGIATWVTPNSSTSPLTIVARPTKPTLGLKRSVG